MYEKDRRIVITLDAGGTNFVFGAVQGDRFVVEPITLPSNSDRLDRCLETMVEGFRTVIGRLPEQPAAISFAFPGPADYPRGIIGGYLPNFPSFRDGVALKDFLEERFGIPTFINNDGDLYAYGEALAGALLEINARLEAAGSAKRFRNLIGYTFGTGFGVGIVVDNRLNRGDNSCVETFCLRHKDLPDINVEEGVSIRAVKRLYAEYAGVDDDTLDPKAIFEIAEGASGRCRCGAARFRAVRRGGRRRHGHRRDAHRRTDRHRRRHYRCAQIHPVFAAGRNAGFPAYLFG